MKYAKGIVAVAGATITAALAIFPSGSTTWNTLTILAAAVTALGVILVPNTPSA